MACPVLMTSFLPGRALLYKQEKLSIPMKFSVTIYRSTRVRSPEYKKKSTGRRSISSGHPIGG
jgi:hypothetical protein